MKHRWKIPVSLCLILVLVLTAVSSAFAAPVSSVELRFNEDGKFKIVQFADCQDDMFPRKAMLELMAAALDAEQPDLVVFTGDNITGGGSPGSLLTSMAIKGIVTPVVEREIPFAVVFGNHDHESGVSKEKQLQMYQSYESCLAYDPVPELTGCATYNLPIRSWDDTKDAFNLWMIDSNEYDRVNGGYDWVHEDQIDWYKTKSADIATANGGPVPSLVFQHIVVPEVYEVLKQVPQGTPGSRDRFGKTWALELNPDMATGTLGEWPCPPDYNSGQFQAMVDQGDVLGIVTGHDHVNNFIGTYQGIDFIQSAGIGFQTYGSRDRGYRVIILDENDPWNYETYTGTWFDHFGTNPTGEFGFVWLGSEFATFLPFVASIVFGVLNMYEKLAALFGVTA